MILHSGSDRARRGHDVPMRSLRTSVEICSRPEHLRRTLRIALIVGIVLGLINQSGVVFAGDATTLTWVRVGLNFVVPFVVSNLGLLANQAAPR